MKIHFLLLCLAAIGFGSCGSKHHDPVPKVVVQKFNILFPNATDIEWETEDHLYEASFRQDTFQKSIALDTHGMVQWIETRISPGQIPSAIRDYLSKHSGSINLSEATMIIYPDGSFTYGAEVEGREYLFDEAGQFLTFEAEADDEDE
jgi:hypothetical protein